MNKGKALNIRIKFTPQKGDSEKEKMVYLYHWPRIIGVSLLFILTITAIIYGSIHYHFAPNSTLTITNKTQSSVIKEEQKKQLSLAQKESSRTVSSPAKPLFTHTKVMIFSQHIKRFQLSETVKNREPVGTLSGIAFDGNNIATIYAYSKAIGLNNQTLYYKWSLNNQEIVKVKVRVRGDHWRSYSRKFIRPHMHGEWEVALESEEGEILAVNRFHY